MKYYVNPPPYRYKKASSRRPPSDRFGMQPIAVNNGMDTPPLTGWVNGLEASDLEERFARALRFQRHNYAFQIDFQQPDTPYKWFVDFMVNGTNPVEVYGEVGHDSQEEILEDELREARLNELFREVGLASLQVVKWWELDTQDMANRKVSEMFFGGALPPKENKQSKREGLKRADLK